MVREGVVLMIGQGVSCCFLMPDIANEISDLFVRNRSEIFSTVPTWNATANTGIFGESRAPTHGGELI
jgi:hypothetical protein